MQFLSSLNAQQQTAVTAGSGPVLVLAGPGAGKTRVLTTRIAYLIGSESVRPYSILAVTFTNKAAREMENRVAAMLGGQSQGLTLGTFHSVCARILRREAELLPFDRYFVIFDTDDQISLIKQALRDLDLDDKRFRPQGVHASISNAKNELILAEDFPIQTYRDEVVARIFRRYQELLLASNALDFDDLLLYTAYLLEEIPEVREKYARRYEHVLVDEFQDTNMAQYRLLKHLASAHNNIFVVGDTDQSIYRWRGADYRNVLRFEEDFPAAEVVLLEQNYRSTQNILDVAMAVIEPNPFRTPKNLFTDRGAGNKITLHECYDDREEAQYTVDAIATLIATGQADPGDFAIMYRTNAQSRLLEEAFLRANLPYRLVGAQRFYGRREVKDMIAYLRLVHNPYDEASLLRVINTPPRRIGNKTIQALRTLAGHHNISPVEILLDLARGEKSSYYASFSAGAAQALSGFGSLVAGWRAGYEEMKPLALMDRILENIGYREYLDDGSDEGRDRWENVMELRRLAADYANRTLMDFLEDVALVSDQDTLEADPNSPTLLTLHAAKGLEFPIVFIVGLQDGTLPHIRSFDDPEGMAEERRLFYVGITRAQNRLIIVFALNRSSYGYTEPADYSRFLDDIPPSLVVGDHPNELAGQTRLTRARLDTWDAAGAMAPEVKEQRYQPGDRIQHPSWGEGMVLNSKVEDDDEIVDIFFTSVGKKRVSASIANLEIL
ncbi:MAG: UvrD-helicase domain-containing protein [Anaerolineales bacterium]|nr:UvrD-helicase domain-containing protein [Anaerolineales bacterium]